MSKNISPDSVWSGRTCPANLGVLSCPVRKLICPVRSSPIAKGGGTQLWTTSLVHPVVFEQDLNTDPGHFCLVECDEAEKALVVHFPLSYLGMCLFLCC